MTCSDGEQDQDHLVRSVAGENREGFRLYSASPTPCDDYDTVWSVIQSDVFIVSPVIALMACAGRRRFNRIASSCDYYDVVGPLMRPDALVISPVLALMTCARHTPCK
jgi:hypothetical protein